MPGERFNTPYDSGEELKRFLGVIEEESRRARSIAEGGERVKSEVKSELEDYEIQLDPIHFGATELHKGIMLLARVVRLLVQLELRRMK